MMGVAGAGKTVIGSLLAAALRVPFVEGDDLHPPANVAKMAQGIPLTDADRLPWLNTIAAQIAAAARRGSGIVVSCSALKRAYRDILRGADPHLQFVHLMGDRELIAQRLGNRAGHFMPASLLDSQLVTLEIPAPDEHAWTFDLAEPPERIVAQIVQRLADNAA